MLGHELPGDSKAARARMGVVPQLDNLDTTLTVEQNLIVFSHLYRVARADRQAAIERVLDIANLADRRDAKVDELSGGMRRRLLIGRALIHRPPLVLLDEPTVGLDPQVRQELWALIDAPAHGGDVDPHVDALHRGGRAPLPTPSRSSRTARPSPSGPPADLVAEHAGGEAVEVYGSPARLEEAEAEMARAGAAHAPHRHVDRRAAGRGTPTRAPPRASAGRRTSRTCSCC